MELLPGTEEIMDSLRIICQEEIKSPRLQPDLPAWKKAISASGRFRAFLITGSLISCGTFSESYPNIRFELTVDGFSALKEKIQSDQLDCIFVSRYSVPDLPFIPLGSDELMLVTPLDHPLAEQLTVSLTDISGENFVLSSDGLDYETGKIFETNHITPKIQYQLNEDFATLKMVEQGFGITILPRLLLEQAPFQICVRPFSEHYSLHPGRRLVKRYPAIACYIEIFRLCKNACKEVLCFSTTHSQDFPHFGDKISLGTGDSLKRDGGFLKIPRPFLNCGQFDQSCLKISFFLPL